MISPAEAHAPSKIIAMAIADPARPATDVALDATRQGAAIVAFSGASKGWKVGDLMQGSGYFTRLFVSVVGPKGHVYAWSPPEFIGAKKALYGDSLDTLSRDYPLALTPLRSTFADLAFPEPLDLVFQSQNYHDLHLKLLPADTAAKLNAVAFKALRPGGVYLVVDHISAPGDDTAPNRIHRIDPAVLRHEIEAAGFVFDGESSALRNPADDHTKHVFDASVRGHTDQMVYRFKKPG